MTFILKNEKFVKSSNFALNSDVVYSEVISNSKNKQSSKLDIYVIDKNEYYTFYKLKNFEVQSGDIIFCNSLMLECLFYDLKNLKNINCFEDKITIEINEEDHQAISNLEKFSDGLDNSIFVPNKDLSRGDIILNCYGMHYSEKNIHN